MVQNNNNWEGFWKVRANWVMKIFQQIVHGTIENKNYQALNALLKKSQYHDSTIPNIETNLEQAMRYGAFLLERITKETPSHGEKFLEKFITQFLHFIQKNHLSSENEMKQFFTLESKPIAEILMLIYAFEYSYISKNHTYYSHSKNFLQAIEKLHLDTQNLIIFGFESIHTIESFENLISFKEIIHHHVSNLQKEITEKRLHELEEYKYQLERLDAIAQIIPNLNDNLSKAETLLNQTNTRIDELGRLKNDYNIVVLESGFEHLKKQKISQQNKIKTKYWLLIVAIISIFLLPIEWIKFVTDANSVNEYLILAPYLIKFAISVFLIYLFRLNYLEYKSIAAQILQIDLRSSLCQFFVNYLEQTASLERTHALEMFEKLIFSNLQSQEENIPSTFDGLEQIASLFNNTKNDK